MTTIKELPAVVTPASSDAIPTEQADGTTRQIAPSQMSVLPTAATAARTLAKWASLEYWVEDFLISSENGVVGAATFQRALSHLASNGGGVLNLQNRVYDVSAAPITTGGQNSIIPIPYVSVNSENIVIEIRGSTNVQAYSPPVPSSGTILKATTAGSLINWIQSSVIGYGAASHSTITWNAITLILRNVAVQVEPDSGMVGIDLYAVTNAILDNVTASVNAAPGSIVQPTTTSFVGIKLPATGNFGLVKTNRVYITGFYEGMWFSEHADLDVFFQNCVYGLRAPDSWSHIVNFRQVTTQGCSYSLRSSAVPGAAFTNSVVGYISIERNPEFPFVADFDIDAGAELNGALEYVIAASPTSGVSTSGTGTFNLITQSIPQAQFAKSATIFTPTANVTVSPEAERTLVVPQNGTGGITITVNDAPNVGQSVRIYGNYQRTITVNTGSALYLPEQAGTTSVSMPSSGGSQQYLDLTWGNGSWNAIQANGNVYGQTTLTKGYTVSTLPAGQEGMRTYVTDAASPGFLQPLTGGGSTVCPAFHNGSTWVAA